MSRAKPMDHERRRLIYTRQLGMDPALRDLVLRPMTPRQNRRWRHKVHRNVGSFVPYSLGKGRPTPRRPRRG